MKISRLTKVAIRLAIASSFLVLSLCGENSSLANPLKSSRNQDPAPQILKQGEKQESEIQPGAVQTYLLLLGGQEYFELLVEQRNANVMLTLVGPDGTQLTKINQEGSRLGLERLYWIANSPGNYQIQV
ncbi:MAG: hypothetical protein DMF69_04630, partial [Acidobacteria bacterium]